MSFSHGNKCYICRETSIVPYNIAHHLCLLHTKGHKSAPILKFSHQQHLELNLRTFQALICQDLYTASKNVQDLLLKIQNGGPMGTSLRSAYLFNCGFRNT